MYPGILKILVSTLKYLLLTVILFSSQLLFQREIFSAENNIEEKQPGNTGELNLTKLSWPVNLDHLDKNNSSDESLWVDAKNEKVLVLKYRSKGRKQRGDIIILPAQGENADHPRVVRPLSVQLSQLGWNVLIPTLPLEDYPEKLIPESPNEIDNQSDGTEDNNPTSESASSSATQPPADTTAENSEPTVPMVQKTFFPDAKSYQDFVSQLILEVIAQVEPTTNNLVMIGLQNSSYWMLNSAKNSRRITQVVLISPQQPKNINEPLVSDFEGQYLPLYTFIENSEGSSAFIDALDKKLWQSDIQRMNRNTFTHYKIALEDVRIAKIITGWVESQQKSN
ncbi:DUF3530 family protein [Aliikangiella coralliicola]|uniref:DUF3530 family protein n=1 Tax=Aliikangiella coralliicola TaxID=2592383 RepID=A0A545UH52_9GAMM|nr:DUF3530 family protein [Aliikangiella coralliicola]TQV88796.1 DUF3530 family protein [Aliikangiella coralliicola]